MLGAQGRQFLCWTNEAEEYIQPKAPAGGGFGYETITLDWLYSENRAHNNIWTASNKYKDLCRYTGCQIILNRHPTTDFIVSYSIQPPYTLNKFSYIDLQPQNMLLQKHKRIILSQESKPHGKRTVKIKIKPPKEMSTKWYFQKQFSDYPLILLKAVACNFRFPRINPKSQSQLITLYYLDTQLFTSCNWAATIDKAWMPSGTTSKYTFYYQVKGQTTEQTLEIPSIWRKQGAEQYYESIHKDTGWFRKEIMNCTGIKKDSQARTANRAIYVARYNPNEDTGQGNLVYAVSILQKSWQEPITQHDFVIAGQPLWMAFHGFYSFLKLASHDKVFDTNYMFIVRCPAIRPVSQPTAQSYYPFIDKYFIDGTLPFDEYVSENIKQFWYPQAKYQQQTINQFVEAGPFIPKYSNITYSTWELNYKYKFYFKWGGPQVSDIPVDDPTGKGTHPTTSNQQETVQISDPKKQDTKSILHDWDYRRGYITQTALKRMSENLETDTDFQSDESGTPKKKRKVSKKVPLFNQKEEEIKACLQTLCEENTCQDSTEDLHKLIQQQQQQQQLIKHNILRLLTHLKKQQRFLSLQTGHLE